ncbi:hypothetical protein [Actinokineospora globicatena]|uniref:hypothetical protein n=1 Tax=Actinokineospora globicatena TaxID=103729 RepID=UPI0020A470C6|nr:hypothetical protein [Actinokineospora globicatena]MCP2306821.1 hypothetical protein [Actinokineospora globicatena]GLW82054.1 hypothetical protein Aglo01_65350 [Actinokineospora globicatena]GLW88848.1 hypothetical protein Aglo02_64870 [Actinokineospora globicatena]
METPPQPRTPTEIGDATYLASTLRHEPIDLLLDDSTGDEYVRRARMQSAQVGAAVFVFALILETILTLSVPGATRGGWALGGAGVAVLLAWIRWLVFLYGTRKAEPISEWNTLLVDRASAAESVYSHIAGLLRDRRLPVAIYYARRWQTPYNSTGNRLVLVDGRHVVYVSVFQYGTGLYLGWSMWLIRTGRDMARRSRSRMREDHLDYIDRILNLERLKAMREAVHAVCREALHTAVRDIEVDEGYGFPGGLPAIEGLPYGSAPAPDVAAPAPSFPVPVQGGPVRAPQP